MNGPAAFEIRNLAHWYTEKKVLDIKRLDIPKGSIIGLQGPNGSGKSTLLKILAFAMKPTKGQILFNGRPETPFSPGVRSKVTLLTQKPYLLKRTVFDNIAYGLKIRRDKRNLDERICRALASVGLDNDSFARRKWHELSGGEAQRVAMAARLILEPEVLLLDEPVASVDTKSAGLIRKASLDARKNWGTTLVIASHDLRWLYECSDTQISISNGKIFSLGREIVIPGPYEKSKDPNKETRPLGDGKILLPLSPDRDKTAVIGMEKIDLIPRGSQAETTEPDNRIPGLIVSMVLEKQTGHIMTLVRAHDLSIAVRLDPTSSLDPGLAPGKKVDLVFSSSDITWR